MDIVDTHFHIFDFSGPLPYPWPTADDKVLYRNHLAEQYRLEAPEAVKHAVFVQTINDCPQEIDFVANIAKKHTFIKGIVGGLDISKPSLSTYIGQYKESKLLVGIRQILDFESSDWLLKDDVMKGLKILEEEGLTFDLLLRPPLMKHVSYIAKQVPNLKMVVDHIAKPYVKDQKIDGWKEDMAEIAKCPNVYCKLSGLVTEADLVNWKTSDFKPYVEHVLSVFGVERIMFGSDWPIFYLANASYDDILKLAEQLLEEVSSEDKEKIFSTNAIKFYKLDIPDN